MLIRDSEGHPIGVALSAAELVKVREFLVECGTDAEDALALLEIACAAVPVAPERDDA